MAKERLDVLLTEQGFFESREASKRGIMAGIVLVNDEPVDKPGTKISTDATIRIKGTLMPYVSRGGFKLKKALDVFSIDLTDRVMIDVGASTGGFTDCGLINGAKFSYAIDVGSNQLAWKLRQDPRVLSMEKTNFRHMEASSLTGELPTFACMDVSFISIKLLLPVLKKILPNDGEIVALIKPQFEAGKQAVGKNGIIKDKAIHYQVVSDIVEFARHLELVPLGLSFSPIRGSAGNIEFLIHLSQKGNDKITDEIIKQVINEAHTTTQS